MDENTRELTTPCTECQAGKMHRKHVTYITYIGDELITVPDFPAWVCDICGRSDYDMQALNQLTLLLSPNAGKPTIRKPHIAQHPEQRQKDVRPGKGE
jgi:YgiT-type zinc finger domain-containing protein